MAVFEKKWINSTKTPTYNSWRSMRNRVLFDSCESHRFYKAKGISICERWIVSFDDFVSDMGFRPEGTTLDRINPDGNYEPSNCRWVTMRVQQNNKHDLTEIEHNGEVKTIGQWAYELDLDDRQKNTIYKRRSKYNAKTYNELFCDHLLSYRKSIEKHECLVCKITDSKKWRKGLCANCYARALRYYKKAGKPINVKEYSITFGGGNG